MAVESKPLFHPDVIRQQVRAFHLPERVETHRPALQRWADLLASGRADTFKASDLLPDFLTDILCGLLGYTRPAGPADTYTRSRECHVQVDGQFANVPKAALRATPGWLPLPRWVIPSASRGGGA
jgi:hypothetical protein